MRLWSLHPSLLDRQGLTAAWREALLAQKVLAGGTVGYRNHPQLERFRQCADPGTAIATFLHGIADEAVARGYRFDRSRIDAPAGDVTMEVTEGQVAFEWRHLLAKLAARSPEVCDRVRHGGPILHPMFRQVPGAVASWERPVEVSQTAT